MRIRGNIQRGGILLASVIAILGVSLPVAADSLSSTNYKIDTSVAAPIGGMPGSTNYKMTAIGGGEASIGSQSSTSYKVSHGYVAQLVQSIQLSIVENPVALGTVTPGASNTATLTSQIFTDAPGYNLDISQNNDLTNGGNTIPAISSGTIASPATWTEGTTKGLGVTLTTCPGSCPGKWGTAGSYKYAAIPGTATTIFTRSGFSGGVQDSLVMQPRLDAIVSQPEGLYSNTVTITVTTIP